MDIISFLSQLNYETYWGVFLFGIVISTTAMSTGIDGAIFWAPVLLLVYKVDPAVAISCAIFIELFGFGSGIRGYAKRKKIQYKQAFYMLMFTVPLGVLGAYVSKKLPTPLLIFFIACTCLFLVYSNLKRAKKKIKSRNEKDLALIDKKQGGILSSIGGFFAGAVGVGIGETNNYYLLIKNKYPATFATGTTVFMIAMTDIFISTFNFLYFKKYSDSISSTQVASILIFAIPAVVMGARLGVILAHKLKRHHFDYYLATVFTIVAMISFYRAFAMIDIDLATIKASILGLF